METSAAGLPGNCLYFLHLCLCFDSNIKDQKGKGKARTLLGAKGIATRSDRTLLVAPGLTTRSKNIKDKKRKEEETESLLEFLPLKP